VVARTGIEPVFQFSPSLRGDIPYLVTFLTLSDDLKRSNFLL